MMRTLLLTVVCLTPAFALAGIEGRYSTGDCADPDSDGHVSVTADSIGFYESSCTLENPTALRGIGKAILYDMACSGGTETWTENILLMPDGADRLLLVENGYWVIYQRCE